MISRVRMRTRLKAGDNEPDEDVGEAELCLCADLFMPGLQKEVVLMWLLQILWMHQGPAQTGKMCATSSRVVE